MAIQTERLVATLEMRLDKYEKALKKAQGDTTKSFDAITSAGDRLEGRLSRVGSGGMRSLDGVSRSAQNLSMQTGNLAAQFNDIGVQLAGGQSPFLIALQQGSQISQVLGPAGALGAVRALGGAFMSMINPVSLLTFGIIALGGAAVQYFLQMLSDSEDSEETLQKQAQLIQQVAAEWGNAIPALKEYADEVARLAEIQDIISAADAAVSQKWAPIREEVSGLNVEMADLQLLLRDLGETESLVRLNTEFQELADKIEDGTATAEDAEQVQAALADTFTQTQIPAINALIERFTALSTAIANASGSAAAISEQAAFAAGLEKSVLPQLGTVGKVYSAGGELLNESGLIQYQAERTKSQTQIAAEKAAARASRGGGRGGRGGRGDASDVEREQEAIGNLIETLEFEQQMLGATDLEREKANALRRAGSSATDKQKAKISALIETIYAEEEALHSSEQAMRELNDLGRDVLGGFVSDLRQGKSAADALANALDRVVDKILDGALDNLFGGGSGGGFGGLLSSIFGGFRASGGPVSAGKAYVVGEKGPELLVPGQAGAIVPNKALGGSSAVHVTVGVDVDKSGNLMPFVAQVSDQRAQVRVQQGQQRAAKQYPALQSDLQRRTG